MVKEAAEEARVSDVATKPKLTRAQKEFLAEMSEKPQTAYDGYKPAIKLVEVGFAVRSVSRFGSVSFAITDAGLAALASPADGQKR